MGHGRIVDPCVVRRILWEDIDGRRDVAMNDQVSPNVKNFRPYGKIIEYQGKEAKGSRRNLWRIIHVEATAPGWRIAWLVLRDKTIGRLECHPYSDESLEPVRGRALLFIAEKPRLEYIRCFDLDKPLIVRKGVWHGLIAVDDEAEIKITENAEVTCSYWPLGFRADSLERIIRRNQARKGIVQ
jgi:ureidoglycolate hydrolase